MNSGLGYVDFTRRELCQRMDLPPLHASCIQLQGRLPTCQMQGQLAHWCLNALHHEARYVF